MVVTTKWTLSLDDMAAVATRLGQQGLTCNRVVLTRRYEEKVFKIEASLNFKAIIEHLLTSHGLDDDERAPLADACITDELRKAIEALP